MAWSYLYSLGLSGHPGAAALAAGLGNGLGNELGNGLGNGLGDERHSLERIIDRRVNSPLTSSMGRLFDAVSAILEVCRLADYEGQPAIELEAALYDRSTGLAVVDADADEAAGRYRFQITDTSADGHRDDALPSAGRYRPALQSGQEAPAQTASQARNKDGQGRCASASRSATLTALVAMRNTSAHGNGTIGCEGLGGDGLDEDGDNGGFYQFDPRPVLQAILDDLVAGLPVALASLRFHDAVVRLMVESCRLASARTGLTTVALGGGVFMNRYLLAKGRAALETDGFTVLQGRELPPNDGCISYGQAAVAAARLAATQDLA
jgi:hydrogenase maturation protein HypF